MRRLLALWLLWAAPAHSATINVTLPQSDPPVALVVISGTFVSGDFEAFQFRVANVPSAIVILRSDGGSLLESIQIGRLIRLRGYPTVVPDGVRCASACAIAWLGGAERYMGSTAYVGFHAAYRTDSGKPTETGVGNALLGAYLSQIGLSETAIFYITKAPPDQMTWLTVADAARHGIRVQLLSNLPTVPQPAFPTPSVADAVENQTRQFVQSLFARWSAPSLDVSELVGATYEEQTNYYGKVSSRDDLITDKRQFVQRWPLRRYTLQEASLQVRCASEGTCTVSALTDWATFNPTTLNRARGLAEVQYEIHWRSQLPRIYSENSKVVARSKEVSLAARAGTGWWVIMGAFKAEDEQTAAKVNTDVRWATGRAYLCGADTFSDLSKNFAGFSPGYRVVVAGPFLDKRDAIAQQQQVQNCLPGAYIKQATRSG